MTTTLPRCALAERSDAPDLLREVNFRASQDADGVSLLKRSDIRLVHPVFAAATPLLQSAWAELKTAAKAARRGQYAGASSSFVSGGWFFVREERGGGVR